MTVSNITPMPASQAVEPDLPGDIKPTAQSGVDSWHEFALVERLQEQGYHPVLMFGTSHSGKTCLLLSLLAYSRTNADSGLNVQLGDNVFPDSFPGSAERYRKAWELFHTMTVNFMLGKTPGESNLGDHYIIPLVVTVNRQGQPPRTVKLAFVEGMGEWYDLQTGGAGFVPLRPEINALLQRFPNPLSVMFLAPVAVTKQGRAAFQTAHQSVSHCMERYTQRLAHSDGAKDSLLLLATHWDRKFSPGTHPEQFAEPSSVDIEQVLNEWRMSWPTFSRMKVTGNKAVTPYCAALIHDDGKVVNQPGPQQKRALDHFNRTLWDWLYRNASIAAGHGDDVQPLYPETGKRPPLSKLDRLIGTLLWEFEHGVLPWRRRA